MVFIVKKNIKGNEYYYLNENKRQGGKVKTKTLAYLGKTRKQAEEKMKQFLKEHFSKNEMIAEKNPEVEIMEPYLEKKEVSIDELSNFCKRKGFIYPSSEIYGGLAGFYDYGSKGVLLKKNLEKMWLHYFLGLNENFFQIETAEIMPEKVFLASGHLKNFTDIAAKCKKGHIERADHLLEKILGKRFEGLDEKELFEIISKNKISCSVCGSSITYVGLINMMFPVSLGVGESTKAFLRPETAQSPYVNFKTEYEINRNKLPLGLALVGRAYRNELSPRNLLLRQRAFNQAELQIFFNPSKINKYPEFEKIKNYGLQVVLADEREKGEKIISCLDLLKKVPEFYVYYMAKVQEFYLNVLKIPKPLFRFYELNEKEKAFYNKYHFDMEIKLSDLGWVEIGGVHYRTEHDLKGHKNISKQNLLVFDEESKEKFIPHVLELSFGLDRLIQSIITLSYYYDKGKDNIVLKLNPNLAPIKVAIFPIVKGEKYEKISKKVVNDLKKTWNVVYDQSGSIGRRYARNDEIGTPFCVTIDELSLKQNDVTIRDRNTTRQVRIKISELKDILSKLIDEEIDFYLLE